MRRRGRNEKGTRSLSYRRRAIHLLVIVHCFMLRGMYNSCRR